MSFYGDIKRVNSSPFVFDRYFPNRKDMEDKMGSSDGVYVGRFVLIRYDCAYKQNSDTDLEFFTRWTEDGSEHKSFVNNYNIDLNKYHDTFNGTVWQKIYTNINGIPSEKYIMVAELNADAPSMHFRAIAPKKLTGVNTEIWNRPEVIKEAASEEAFIIKMPNVLRLSIGNMNEDFYGRDLLNPAKSGTLPMGITKETAFLPENNVVSWENYNYQKDEDGNIIETTRAKSLIGEDIDEKEFSMKLYGFGQAISNMYDALYGVPGSDGKRPFFTTDNVVTPENKGLIGILTSIGAEAKGDLTQDTYGRSMNNGMHYYFISKWKSADEDPQAFIENIPDVIGASENNGGSSACSQLYINFDATSTTEGELPSYVTKWS